MAKFQPKPEPEERDEPVAAVLAEMTGRPQSDFELDGEYDYPDLDELESVPEDEW
ncbi:hypothetical protein [Haloarcula laminariae]|uniref:hypothetical protein n=1 Tax=Haloarcula laminariae TaxID=2961577 RepID=UPI0021C7FC58|nr:hypothetical protein [Halomicroarcula laminariae]